MATHVAASASYADVNTAYGLCSAGDTLSIPAGSATWATKLSITKGLYVIGAGVGSTVITNGIGSGAMLSYDPSNYDLNTPFRLNGIEFDANGARIIDLGSGKTAPYTLQTAVRIDHNKFKNSGASTKGQAIWNYGSCYGVVDNNEFIQMGYPVAYSYGISGDGWWSNSPQNLFSHGSAYYLYFEDNTFNLVAYGGGDNALTDGEYAARYCFRYNSIINTVASYSLFDQHGEQSGMPSCFGAELYGNNVSHGAYQMTFFKQRGGQSLVFLNNATTTGSPENNAYTGGLDICPANYANLKNTHNSYWWGSRKNLTGTLWSASCNGGLDCNGLTGIPTLGRDVFSDGSTPGVSSGPLGSIPGTCSVGQGYWATDQSVSDLTGMVGVNPATKITGVLYRCLSTNVWTAYYSPYTYPHPLRGSAPYMRFY
jgi:hypothetical protein